ncbi:MAG: acyclic terpene utilization AtuA family protein [Pirellulaceae bacterium]|nr:acyclic terpene utilization AtuA family protein [Pirellulaceae bacterium]
MIRVGNAQAFWGDRPSAAVELLTQVPDLDFLTMDYLAEVSMSILAIQRERDPSLGYAQDFVEVVMNLAAYWKTGGRCRLIANAGGLNPLGCAQACAAALEKSGCRSLKIGVVSGDNVLSNLIEVDAHNTLFQNLDSHEPLSKVRDRLVTANAYLGCQGIVESLRAGADIVITGRIADPSMVVAPCVYSFEWGQNDWDRLAGATVAGHLLECGTHVTGGISTDWLDIPDPAHIGFPIAEIRRDGSCTITKSKCSGGHVTLETVKEQLIYEIGDPNRYQSPDVTVSFLNLKVNVVGKDRVAVDGAIGRPKPDTLKVSATYRDGFRAAGMITIFGAQSVRKARRCGEIVLQRLREAGCLYRDAIVESLGNAASVPVGNLSGLNELSYESVLRIAVESESKAAVEKFSREMIPLVTAGPQGTTGYAEGRPRVHPVFRYWPCLIEADQVPSRIEFITTEDKHSSNTLPSATEVAKTFDESPADTKLSMHSATIKLPSVESIPFDAKRLSDIAYGRSGDKGTGANIGILVRSMEHYGWLKTHLTAIRVKHFFDSIGVDSIERFEMPNLGGFNFLVRGILRRGLRNDAQGKALAQALLSISLTDLTS